MGIFSFLGFIFFGVAGILMIFNAYTQLVVQITAMALCLLAALLFLIDITMVLAFWKRRCTACKRCCDNSAPELLPHKNEEPKKEISPEIEIMRHDVTTSLSDVRVPRELENANVAIPDHCYRKVENARRREYVDCPTCVPSLCNLGEAQIQTETKKVSVVEIQTPSAVTKETPMQTLSKCEFCHQQIQLPVEGAGVPGAHCFQQPSSQWSYPAVVQFVRGGGVPCCPGCKCGTDAAQTQQQQQQPQESTQQKPEQKRTGWLTPKVKSNPSKTLTSETTQQVASTENENNDNVTSLMKTQPITTYTVAAFYDSDKKMQTVPDIVYKRKMDTTKIKKGAKPTSEDDDRNFAEETIMKIAKTKRPETVEEAIFEHVMKRRNEDNAKESEEKQTIGVSEKIERSKGGGEHGARIYQEFMRADQGSVANSEEPSMHTGGTLITPLSSRTKPRTLLHLKSNKVDPIKNANTSDEDCTLEKVALRTALDNQAAQESEHPTRAGSPNPIIDQLNDACSLCRRQKILTPTSDNSRCYIVFKDKRGKYFCEFCAPLDSKKITSRLEGTDLRKLRCTNCRLHFRDRGVRTNVKPKSDTCPRCGRSQRHAASPSST
ncbi:uncharacterized protein [Temnothorax longispinosus]|uniref:uncharacterized protein n=1 Tax=Temnothorax longispinosus TaxID=300112 RepID=UPI003A9940D7